MSGWTIIATNTATGAPTTTTTDANGYYSFNNLPVGTYTVSEQLQPNWSQTFPGSPGTYTVTLSAGQVVIQKDFGNCKRPCARVINEEIRCIPGSQGSYTYTFGVSNLSGTTANNMLLTPSVGNFTITPASLITFNPPLLNNHTTTQPITVTLNGVQPGNCFLLTLLGSNPAPPDADLNPCRQCCCSVEVCPVLPSCGCSCSPWSPVTVNWSGSLPQQWTGNCGDSTYIAINSGTPISINSSINCSPGCQPSYTWSVTESPGTPPLEGPWNGTGLPASFSPTSAGNFTVVLNASCDGTPCPPCVVYIYTKIYEPPPCSCSQWSPVTVNWSGSSPQEWKGNCGDTLTVISINPGTAISINSSVACPFVPVGVSCSPSYDKWTVTKTSTAGPAEGPWHNPSMPASLPASFTPHYPGTFKVELFGRCGTVACPPCVVYINIEKIGTASCSCLPPWDSVIVNWSGPSSYQALTWTGSSGGPPTMDVYAGMPISINSSIQCTSGCNPSYMWTVTKIVGPQSPAEPPQNGNTLPASFIPQSAGTFQVELFASCGTVACPSRVFDIVIKNVYPSPLCSCIQWNPVTVNWFDSSPKAWTGTSGDTLTGISIDSGTAISINSSVQCASGGPVVCVPGYTWTVTKPGGSEGPWINTSPASLPFSFTPQSGGTFQVVISASCGPTPCPPCQILISAHVETQLMPVPPVTILP